MDVVSVVHLDGQSKVPMAQRRDAEMPNGVQKVDLDAVSIMPLRDAKTIKNETESIYKFNL